jgi:hypothetical protein
LCRQAVPPTAVARPAYLVVAFVVEHSPLHWFEQSLVFVILGFAGFWIGVSTHEFSLPTFDTSLRWRKSTSALVHRKQFIDYIIVNITKIKCFKLRLVSLSLEAYEAVCRCIIGSSVHGHRSSDLRLRKQNDAISNRFRSNEIHDTCQLVMKERSTVQSWLKLLIATSFCHEKQRHFCGHFSCFLRVVRVTSPSFPVCRPLLTFNPDAAARRTRLKFCARVYRAFTPQSLFPWLDQHPRDDWNIV